MFFKIIFKNQEGSELPLDFQVYDTNIAQRWYSSLVDQCNENNAIREQDRLYNFPNNEWTEEKLVDELNNCIAVINSNEKVIYHLAFVGMPQDQLNRLHHYFENLRGAVLSPSEFWQRADHNVQEALERFNIIIHRAENFYNSTKKTNALYPRIVCTFNDRIRHELLDDDYQYFTLLRKFGEVYINYCEVGKPLYDVFKDGDEIIGDDNIRPLRYYSADFTITFHERTHYSVNRFLEAMNNWWDDNTNSLLDLGFKKNDPKNAIGNIPVAKLLDNNMSQEYIIERISNINNIDRVEIIDK